jgi:hypothetical protein
MSTLFVIRRVFPLTEDDCRPRWGRFVRAFTDRTVADDCRTSLERGTHQRLDINPFEFGDELEECTSLTSPILGDWLLDTGVTPPETADDWSYTWRHWWEVVSAGFTELQRERVWQGLDKVHCFELLDLELRGVAERIAYIVQRRNWHYSRNRLRYRPDLDDTFLAFSERENAEAHCRRLAEQHEEEAREWFEWDGSHFQFVVVEIEVEE